MAKSAARSVIRELARRGAELRVRELKLELAAIYRLFPDLRSDVKPRYTDDGTTFKRPRKRRARKMSAAARKAVSARMKKYWAQRRAAGTKGAR